MIASFRSKDLKSYWTRGNVSGIRPDWRKKVKILLSVLDVMQAPEEMDLPGFGFHALIGDMSGRYAVAVSRNWRITFGWLAPDAIEVDLEDYHG
ncbi:type II toxin-antitoxin system RelE/ParE family toxin [Acidisphaera sp. L21]|uniref:type II toxin-antitoxin system RelE/ParE family toxin n=1 Tax=Acidisphaera sp. L21 TaxID=1641851 RepID=UPI00131A875A|nr:type II toxin-antitoxin system RelE/ParE family toxin [Acidisphaera sp. L21]